MEPVLYPEPWGFAVWAGQTLPEAAFALIREAEGTTLIAPVLELAGLDHGPAMARISLTIHSALEAVGLTAAISGALAAEGISANVVAAFHHDHLFVPWARRMAAMAVLRDLARG
jgi:hypothetical protein